MSEKELIKEFIAGTLLLGIVPAVVFAALSKTSSRRIIRLLAIATILIYGVPAVVLAYFWLGGWPIAERGPLADSSWNWTLDYDLAATWLILVATFSVGLTFGVRHRRFCSMLPYSGLFGFQLMWAILDTAFYIALID